MRLAGDESGVDQTVDQAGDVAGAHPHCVGEGALGGGAAVVQLPQQVGAGAGESVTREAVRHVLVEQRDELEYPVEGFPVTVHCYAPS
jgi:hypothetical protein